MELNEFLRKGFGNYQEIFETLKFFREGIHSVMEEVIIKHQEKHKESWPKCLQGIKPKRSFRENSLEPWFSIDVKSDDNGRLFQVQIGVSWLDINGQHVPRLHAARWVGKDGKISDFKESQKYTTYNDYFCTRISPKTGPVDLARFSEEVHELLTEILRYTPNKTSV